VLRAGWVGAAKAAAWPLGLLLVAALAFAIPSYGQDGGSFRGSGDDEVIGFGTRWRLVLALLFQGLGAGLEIRERAREFGPGSSAGSDGDGFGNGLGGGSGSGSGSSWPDTSGGADSLVLSLVPLTVTVLWIGALLVGARLLRRSLAGQPPSRTAGLEAAVRVTLLVTAGVLFLALFAQPSVEDAELVISPVLAALCAGVLALVVTGGVLLRDDLAQWARQRPGTALAVRALGTAARAMGIVVALCTVVGFVVLATADGTDGDDLLGLLVLLPNLGLLVLGISWGVPVDYDVQGRFNFIGTGSERGSFGLPEIGEQANAGAVVGALALGLVCALVLGVLAGRRLPGQRGGQLLAGGLFLGLFLVLEACVGISFTASGSLGELGSMRGTAEVGPNIPYALLFGLAWVAGAMVVAAFTGRGGGQGAYPGPCGTPYLAPGVAPGGPIPIPPQPGWRPPGQAAGQPPGQAAGQPPWQASGQPPAPDPTVRRRHVLVWGGTVLAAFAVGGGITAGVLLLQDGGQGEKPVAASAAPTASGPASGQDDRPASAAPSAANTEAAGETDGATPSANPTSPPPGDSAGTVPAGFKRADDPKGFSLAVPELWSRTEKQQGQITYAGSTGMDHLVVGVVPNAPYASSYDNFLTLEKGARTRQQGYQRLRLERNTFQGRPGALWEYTYTEEQSGRTVHAIDQGHIAPNGTDYSIYVTAYDSYWQDGRKIFANATSTWRLTG
jgi:hypothetical protein